MRYLFSLLVLLLLPLTSHGAMDTIEGDLGKGYIIPIQLPKHVSDEEAQLEVAKAVNDACAEFGREPREMWPLFEVESGCSQYWPNGKLKYSISGKHVGIGQISSFWANNKVVMKWLREEKGMTDIKPFNLHDMRDNVRCATALISFALETRTKGDLKKAYGWYNTGDVCVNSYARKCYNLYKNFESSVLYEPQRQ